MAIALASTPVSAQPNLGPCTANRLANPDFEHGFTPRSRPQELVGVGWFAFYETLPGIDGVNYAPDYTPRRLDRDGPRAVRSGRWSQELSTRAATHIGGLFQTVEVGRDVQVLASAFAYLMASDGEDPSVSTPPGLYAATLGIDPLGGADPHGPTVLWTEPITVTDAWVPLQLDVPAEGPTVSVFLKGEALERLDVSLSRWDSACLRVIGPAGEPTLPPTRTPPPSATLEPGQPTVTPDSDAREAAATLTIAALEAIATAQRAPFGSGVGAAIVTLEPPVGPTSAELDDVTAGADSGRLVDTLRGHLGLLFLGLAALIAGAMLGIGRRSE